MTIWSDEAHALIQKQGLKEGDRVRIRSDITLTTKRHSKCDDMDKMADSKTIYRIYHVQYDNIDIGGFMWAPEDIILDEDSEPEALPQTNILFDPKDLVM